MTDDHNQDPQIDRLTLERLLALEEPDFTEELGRELLGPTAALGMSNLDRIAKARAWIRENWPLLREKICGHEKLRSFIHDRRKKEDIELAIVIAHVLLYELKPLMTSLVAVLIVRRGLTSLCGEQPNDDY